jgi:hypothetical protein
MVLAALLVAIISALLTGAALVYYRRSAQAAERSAVDSSRSADAAERSAEAATRAADAAAVTAKLDTDRRHSELTPQFRITCQPGGQDGLRMMIFLAGPPELERLDALAVTIRDDHPWRAQGSPIAGGPTPEQVAGQIWGRYRFIPGTGPGASPVKDIPGADPAGRTTHTTGLPVGEELPFDLEPTYPPSWAQWTQEGWRQAVGPMLRLELECRREGWAPWVLRCEMKIEDGVGYTGIPSSA